MLSLILKYLKNIAKGKATFVFPFNKMTKNVLEINFPTQIVHP